MVAAAAVIFLPDLLDGNKEVYQADFEGIPKSPVVITKPTAKPFPTESLDKIAKADSDHDQALADVFEKQPYNQPVTQSVGNTSDASNTTSTTIKINTLNKADDFSNQSTENNQENSTDAVNEAKNTAIEPVQEIQWVVHLGSYGNEKNVKDLISKLTAEGFKVFTKPIKTKNGNLVKVFVGPELVKSTLEKNLQKLKDLTKVDGKLAQYKVTK